METVLNALAGLFVMELYRFDDIYKTHGDTFTNIPNDEFESKLFVLNAWDKKMRFSKVKLDYSLYDEESGIHDFKL